MKKVYIAACSAGILLTLAFAVYKVSRPSGWQKSIQGTLDQNVRLVVLEGPATYGDYQYIKFSLAYGKQYVDARHAFVTSRLWRNVPADIVNMATSQRSYPGWAFPGDLAQAPTAFVTIDQDDRTVVWIGVDGTAIARRPID